MTSKTSKFHPTLPQWILLGLTIISTALLTLTKAYKLKQVTSGDAVNQGLNALSDALAAGDLESKFNSINTTNQVVYTVIMLIVLASTIWGIYQPNRVKIAYLINIVVLAIGTFAPTPGPDDFHASTVTLESTNLNLLGALLAMILLVFNIVLLVLKSRRDKRAEQAV